MFCLFVESPPLVADSPFVQPPAGTVLSISIDCTQLIQYAGPFHSVRAFRWLVTAFHPTLPYPTELRSCGIATFKRISSQEQAVLEAGGRDTLGFLSDSAANHPLLCPLTN